MDVFLWNYEQRKILPELRSEESELIIEAAEENQPSKHKNQEEE